MGRRAGAGVQATPGRADRRRRRGPRGGGARRGDVGHPPRGGPPAARGARAPRPGSRPPTGWGGAGDGGPRRGRAGRPADRCARRGGARRTAGLPAGQQTVRWASTEACVPCLDDGECPSTCGHGALTIDVVAADDVALELPKTPRIQVSVTLPQVAEARGACSRRRTGPSWCGWATDAWRLRARRGPRHRRPGSLPPGDRGGAVHPRRPRLHGHRVPAEVLIAAPLGDRALGGQGRPHAREGPAPTTLTSVLLQPARSSAPHTRHDVVALHPLRPQRRPHVPCQQHPSDPQHPQGTQADTS